jgi:hypothetical protein
MLFPSACIMRIPQVAKMMSFLIHFCILLTSFFGPKLDKNGISLRHPSENEKDARLNVWNIIQFL